MKRQLFLPGLAVILLIGMAGDARAQSFTAVLNGKQEVPPVETRARSFAVFRFLLNDQLLFGYRFNFFHDQEVEMVHIHEAPAGQDGPIVLNLKPEAFCLDIGNFFTIYYATADHLRGRLQGMTLSDLKALMATGNTYLNLHTPENPDGWIRGQFPADDGT
jgi:hypothetical protein